MKAGKSWTNEKYEHKQIGWREIFLMEKFFEQESTRWNWSNDFWASNSLTFLSNSHSLARTLTCNTKVWKQISSGLLLSYLRFRIRYIHSSVISTLRATSSFTHSSELDKSKQREEDAGREREIEKRKEI